MTGRSLMRLLTSDKSGHIDDARDFVLTGLEQHVYLNLARAIRNADFLFIRNFDPDPWPADRQCTTLTLKSRCSAIEPRFARKSEELPGQPSQRRSMMVAD